MNIKRYLLAVVAVFLALGVVYIGAQSIFENQFQAVSAAMNFAEQEHPVSWAGRVLYTFVFCYIFLQGYENKGVGEGLRYGFLIGLFLIALDLDWFGATNVVLADAVAMWVTDFVASIVGGAVLAAVYRPRNDAGAISG